jgi:hypothetical protein
LYSFKLPVLAPFPGKAAHIPAGSYSPGPSERALAAIQKAAKMKADLVEARYLLAYLYTTSGNQTGFQEE